MSTEDIYHDLRERIVLLDLEPGARLTEMGLAAEYGVSRTPIRQVLDHLEYDRLVDQGANTGTRVSIVDTKEIRDVWAVRLRIADLLGEFVRSPVPGGLIERLREIRTDLEAMRASGDARTLGALYNRYHDAVLVVISNETLRRIHDQLFHQTARVWMQFLSEMDLDAEIDIMADEIDQSIEALERGSGTQLAAVRAAHMRALLDRFNLHVTRPIG
jgi:DNA-binding GntR family transcriptional regulator